MPRRRFEVSETEYKQLEDLPFSFSSGNIFSDTIFSHCFVASNVLFISGICLNYDDENILFCAGDHVDELNGIGNNSTCHKYDGSKYIKTANTKSEHFRGGFARFKQNNALLICKIWKKFIFSASKMGKRVQKS